MNNFFQDLRFGLRIVLKRPGFTAVAVVTLALGIGANTAIFSIVNSVLLRPLSYPEPERIVQSYWQWNKGETPNVTAMEYEFWRENSDSFEETAAIGSSGAGFNLAGGAAAQRVRGMQVSESFFRVLGVSPALGRSFTPEEDSPGGPVVAVLSDGLWRRYFGGDRAVIGHQIQLNGRSCSIIGVLPPGFHFEAQSDVFVPLQMKADAGDQGHNTVMIARLKSGTSLDQAQADVDRLLPQFREAYPNHAGPTERGVRLVPYHEHVTGDVSGVLLLLFGAVGLVLLIACANVANLLLSRAASRNGEMAVRVAMGARRWRLMRQLMTENLLLAILGGGAGLILALWSVPVLLALSPEELPRFEEIGLDLYAVLFAILVSIITSLLFGIASALRATRLDINESLKSSSGRTGSGSGARVRGLLVVGEVAISLVLLVGAGLLVKSFVKLRSVELGFDPENLTAMQVSLNSREYRSAAQVWELERQITERISALPGVTEVATVPGLPMERGLNSYLTIGEGAEQIGRSVECRAISPAYFRALEISLLGGRAFTDADTATSAPVVIVNENLAQRFWPDRDPLGEQVSLQDRKWQVIGVAKEIKEMGLDQPTAATVYVPMPQMPDGITVAMNRWFLTSWLVRTSGPLDLNAALRGAVRDVAPQLPVSSIRPMTDVVSGSLKQQRFITSLMGIFSLLALALAAVGLYGMLSYQVSQRTREIGIRQALGAQSKDVLKMVMGQGMLLTLIGIGIGLAGALALTRLMESYLYEVTTSDPATFIVISLLLAGVAFVACYIPARRATRVDPMVALRYE
ncbi:MAG: ABC transporter permease [Blastocatellia bacterium]|nr:ABC transporter permease [Blastocatellia bacterium]